MEKAGKSEMKKKLQFVVWVQSDYWLKPIFTHTIKHWRVKVHDWYHGTNPEIQKNENGLYQSNFEFIKKYNDIDIPLRVNYHAKNCITQGFGNYSYKIRGFDYNFRKNKEALKIVSSCDNINHDDILEAVFNYMITYPPTAIIPVIVTFEHRVYSENEWYYENGIDGEYQLKRMDITPVYKYFISIIERNGIDILTTQRQYERNGIYYELNLKMKSAVDLLGYHYKSPELSVDEYLAGVNLMLSM